VAVVRLGLGFGRRRLAGVEVQGVHGVQHSPTSRLRPGVAAGGVGMILV
jgi:hypothetical protein